MRTITEFTFPSGRPGRPRTRPPAAPKRMMNHLSTGQHVDYKRLVVGELPNKMLAIKREARAYRRVLEDEVLAVKDAISFTDSHLIDTAAAATIQAGICRWLLRNRLETMTVSDIARCSQDIVKAKQARDLAVRGLKLDAPPPPIWEGLDAEVITRHPDEPLDNPYDEGT